ncbi:MAG: 3-deoxy-manno-octulosonate cytidylyltransferase [Crocinitomicaceae bacterium]|nr:3-deoxy-manno-octulosonate cytidylyltransferase [Crocinitomicaceae bacterium]
MRVLGIIPSRYESTRFPGKPLVDIMGKSMIQRVYEQASKSSMITDLVVATDDQRIYDHVKGFGGEVVMTSKDHQNGTERCGEVIQYYDDIVVVINIQGDEPLIQPQQLDLVLELFADDDASVEIGTLVKRVDSEDDLNNPNRIKVVLDDDRNALYFSRSPIPYRKSGGEFFKHIGIYAWRIEVLEQLLELQPTELEKLESLEQLRWLFNGFNIRTAETTIETPNIDTPEDLQKVLQVLGRGNS